MIKHLLISAIVLYTLNIKAQTTNVLEVTYDLNVNLGIVSDHYRPVLLINNKESIFKWGKTIDVKDPEAYEVFINLDSNEKDSIGSFNYISLQKDSMFSRLPWLHSKVYILKEKIPKINWTLINESKNIGKFNCSKARGFFRGRLYTAWYTLDIPVSIGPWKLQGLPGLIVQAEDEKKQITFNILSIKHVIKSGSIKPTINGNIISLAEYKKQRKSFSKDLLDKISTKLPRGATVKITAKTKGMEIFDTND